MIDPRERMQDEEEARRAAFDAMRSGLWTSLPGIVQSFDPVACTAVIQPATRGRVTGTDGVVAEVDMPLLVDVPVIFPHSREFALTFPIMADDECKVWFACRCIDGWWQSGGVQPPLDLRMHDLSDGFALVGPWSQKTRLDPPVHADNVQLRTTDGKAFIEIAPDKTITALNPEVSAVLTPGGTAEVTASQEITLTAPRITLDASEQIALTAPQISARGNMAWTNYEGTGPGTYRIRGDIEQEGHYGLDGTMDATDDVRAKTVSLYNHVHAGVQAGPGVSGVPQG